MPRSRGLRILAALKEKTILENLELPKYDSTKGTSSKEQKSALEGTL